MAHEDPSASESLYVRPVIDEFKAFVQHKIEVLERFKNVEELRVYLDALELGLNTIQDIQLEAKEDIQITEVEFQGGPEGGEPSEESGVETEEIDGGDDESEEEFALANAGEVLVGEKEEGGGSEADQPGDTEETLRAADADGEKPYLDVGGDGEEEAEKHDTRDPDDGDVGGVLATRFVKLSEEDDGGGPEEDNGSEIGEGEAPAEPEEQPEGEGHDEGESGGGDIEIEIPEDEIR